MNSQLIHQLTNTNVTDSNLNFLYSCHPQWEQKNRSRDNSNITVLLLPIEKYHDHLYSKKLTAYCAENSSKNIYNNLQ